MKTQNTLLVLAAALSVASPVSANVILYAEYHLGEAGSLGSGNTPLDTSGNGINFTSQISGGTTSVITGGTAVPAVGSTAYLSTASAANEGWYGGNTQYSALATDNFAFGIFVKASENSVSPGTQGKIFQLGQNDGAYSLTLEASGWRASATNVAYIGGAGTFAADTWVHLAVIRSAGVSTFYVDGVATGGTYGTASVNGAGHLSVAPGGPVSGYFDGGLDEARIVTFTAGESTANILNALKGVTAVPEPSMYGLMGAGALAAVALARRRRKRV